MKESEIQSILINTIKINCIQSIDRQQMITCRNLTNKKNNFDLNIESKPELVLELGEGFYFNFFYEKIEELVNDLEITKKEASKQILSLDQNNPQFQNYFPQVADYLCNQYQTNISRIRKFSKLFFLNLFTFNNEGTNTNIVFGKNGKNDKNDENESSSVKNYPFMLESWSLSSGILQISKTLNGINSDNIPYNFFEVIKDGNEFYRALMCSFIISLISKSCLSNFINYLGNCIPLKTQNQNNNQINNIKIMKSPDQTLNPENNQLEINLNSQNLEFLNKNENENQTQFEQLDSLKEQKESKDIDINFDIDIDKNKDNIETDLKEKNSKIYPNIIKANKIENELKIVLKYLQEIEDIRVASNIAERAYAAFYFCINLCKEFDLALIRILKHCSYQFAKNNQNFIITNLKNLKILKILKNFKKLKDFKDLKDLKDLNDLQDFKDLINEIKIMNAPANELSITIVPQVLGANLKILMISDDSLRSIKEINFEVFEYFIQHSFSASFILNSALKENENEIEIEIEKQKQKPTQNENQIMKFDLAVALKNDNFFGLLEETQFLNLKKFGTKYLKKYELLCANNYSLNCSIKHDLQESKRNTFQANINLNKETIQENFSNIINSKNFQHPSYPDKIDNETLSNNQRKNNNIKLDSHSNEKGKVKEKEVQNIGEENIPHRIRESFVNNQFLFKDKAKKNEEVTPMGTPNIDCIINGELCKQLKYSKGNHKEEKEKEENGDPIISVSKNINPTIAPFSMECGCNVEYIQNYFYSFLKLNTLNMIQEQYQKDKFLCCQCNNLNPITQFETLFNSSQDSIVEALQAHYLKEVDNKCILCLDDFVITMDRKKICGIHSAHTECIKDYLYDSIIDYCLDCKFKFKMIINKAREPSPSHNSVYTNPQSIKNFKNPLLDQNKSEIIINPANQINHNIEGNPHNKLPTLYSKSYFQNNEKDFMNKNKKKSKNKQTNSFECKMCKKDGFIKLECGHWFCISCIEKNKHCLNWNKLENVYEMLCEHPNPSQNLNQKQKHNRNQNYHGYIKTHTAISKVLLPCGCIIENKKMRKYYLQKIPLSINSTTPYQINYLCPICENILEPSHLSILLGDNFKEIEKIKIELKSNINENFKDYSKCYKCMKENIQVIQIFKCNCATNYLCFECLRQINFDIDHFVEKSYKCTNCPNCSMNQYSYFLFLHYQFLISVNSKLITEIYSKNIKKNFQKVKAHIL